MSIKSKTAAILSAALCITACMQKEMDAPEYAPGQKDFNVHFNASQAETKTVFGDAEIDGSGRTCYPTRWSENDSQVMISLNYESGVVAGVNLKDNDGKQASFDASFSGVETQAPYVFYIVSPSEAFLWPSSERESVSVTIPGSQTPTAASLDERGQIIVAQSASLSSIPESVDVNFSHITAYGRLTLKNLSLPGGVTVRSVQILSEDQPLAGSWYYNFQDGSIAPKETSSSILIDAGNINVAAEDPIWFACAPVGSMEGKRLKISAILSNGKARVRTITMKSTASFASGNIYQFNLNMSSAEEVDAGVTVVTSETVYQRVNSTSNLAAGDEVIIVNSTTPGYAMTGTGGNSGLSSVAKDATKGFNLGTDGYIRLPEGSSVQKLTVKSISGSSIVLWDGSKYLYYGSSRLQMSTSSTTWTISISNGSATISYKSSGIFSRTYYIRYNSSYFNTSTSSSTVALYKKATLESSKNFDLSTDPVLNYFEYGAYISEANLVYNPTTDQISREYDSAGSLTFTILAPEEEQAVEFSGIPAETIFGDSFTLGLTFISGITTEIEESYQVYVVKEEGHTLWLSDGKGNGFIVKR